MKKNERNSSGFFQDLGKDTTDREKCFGFVFKSEGYGIREFKDIVHKVR